MTSFGEFILTDYFIYFIISVVTAVISLPLAIVGGMSIRNWADRNFFKPKKGFILVRQKLPNDRIKEQWALPTGQEIWIKNVEGIEIKVPMKLEKGWVVFDGNVPMIEMDENGHQIPVREGINAEISSEENTKGWKSAYETGKLVGSLDLLKDIQFWLILTMVVVTAVSVPTAYLSYTTLQQVEKFPDANAIAGQVAVQLLNITNSGAGIPTVPSGVQTVG